MFYFLNPSYWTGKSGKVKEGSICSCTGSVPALDSIRPDDEDVIEEENIVKRQAMQGEVDSNVAVQLHGLVNIFPGITKMGCCKCQKKSPFHALKEKELRRPVTQAKAFNATHNEEEKS